MFIEAALYDVAHMIAKQHALVETLKERKRENWD